MGLGDFLNKIGKRRVYSLLLGIIYVLISYGTALLFFPENISIAMIFFITLLLVPSTAKLISVEERLERRDGAIHFFRDHKIMIEIFLFLFIGIFIGYLMIGSYAPASFEYQNTFLEEKGALNLAENTDKNTQFTGILFNNISVILIAFILSIFYGVGALFLIVLNASIFASFALIFSDMVAKNAAISAAVFSIHFIPEVLGFLLAALAGGVISKALTRERIETKPFRNVVKDATILILISAILILIAAFLEAYITPLAVNALL